MNLLHSHIEQISQSSTAISDLPFSGPRPFTNALLRTTDITSLIRDTEAHERALFTLPNTFPDKKPYALRTRGGNNNNNTQQTSAVSRILGGDLLERIRQAEAASDLSSRGGLNGLGGKADVDVAALLDGAERLCEVYPIAGAKARIAALRTRYQTLATSVERYEGIVEGQVRELERLNRGGGNEDFGALSGTLRNDGDSAEGGSFTRDDLVREEAEIKELEERRRLLELRVGGMERDLGALG